MSFLFFYNIYYSPSLFKLYFKRGVNFKGTFLKNCKIKALDGAHIDIGPKTMMTNCIIRATGSDSRIMIAGGATNIKNSSFVTGMSCGRIFIASGFTSEGSNLKAHEGKTISIGTDCMFSAGINISTTDFHAIIQIDNEARINPAKDITIGNHVWLCRNVDVLKGTIIADDIVVGMNSTISCSVTVSHSVYAGSPARIVKKDTSWRRSLN